MVGEVENCLFDEELAYLKHQVDVVAPSNNFGMDLYCRAIECIDELLDRRI